MAKRSNRVVWGLAATLVIGGLLSYRERTDGERNLRRACAIAGLMRKDNDWHDRESAPLFGPTCRLDPSSSSGTDSPRADPLLAYQGEARHSYCTTSRAATAV